MIKIGLISLGCAKNRVDSEIMLGHLVNKGYELTDKAEEAQVLIVNTCGFIQSAKEESIETILEMAEYKKTGNCQVLIVTGCLSQKYREELMVELPEVDGFIGTNEIDQIIDIVENSLKGKRIASFLNDYKYIYDSTKPRVLTTPNSFAFVKIAEGCNNRCHYCSIPAIRGAYRSRSIEDIAKECNKLGQVGIKEIMLIAQDTTSYGIDVYGETKLIELLSKLDQNNNLKWIRLLYSYPTRFSEELIKTIKTSFKICHYLDIPLQHCNDRLLRRMNRQGSKQSIKDLINFIRSEIPDIVIRTSFIVGLPGETEEDFMELLDFMKDMRFERVGVFAYSREDGTIAYDMDGQVPEEIKQERLQRAMELQQKISLQANQKRINNIYKILVEGKTEDGLYYGRSQYEAPEVDGKIFFSSNQQIPEGSFIDVKITSAYEYDLLGEIIHESS